MRERVTETLETIRPFLQRDGGDVELVDVSDDGVVQVRLTGACNGCPLAQMTLSEGIERELKAQIPELKRVVAVPPDVSQFE